MSDLAASLLVPRAPQVNLIPPEVASRKAAGRARGLVLIALLLFVALLLGVFYLTSSQQSAAKADFDTAVKKGDELNAEIAKYAEIPLVQTQLENAKSARLYAGATEIRWDSFLQRMRDVMPADADIATAAFSATSPVALVAPLEGPYSAPGVGIVAFSGTSRTYPHVSDLERAINSVAGLTDAQIPSVIRVVTDAGVKYTFSGTATLTVEAFDSRFTDAWFVTRNRELADEYLDELTRSSAADITFLRQIAGDAELRQWALDAGLLDDMPTLQDALNTQEAVSGSREAFTSISDALALAESNLEVATAAQADGEEGADALVAAAQSAVDTLAPALDQLASAVLATRAASNAADTVSTRVAAAMALVAAKGAQLKTAEAALDAAVTDWAALQADVEYRRILVSEATAVFEAEQSAVAPAEEAVAAAFEALASATASAETAVITADVTVALKPHTDAPEPAEPTPGPSPTATPSPSATQGSDS